MSSPGNPVRFIAGRAGWRPHSLSFSNSEHFLDTTNPVWGCLRDGARSYAKTVKGTALPGRRVAGADLLAAIISYLVRTRSRVSMPWPTGRMPSETSAAPPRERQQRLGQRAHPNRICVELRRHVESEPAAPRRRCRPQVRERADVTGWALLPTTSVTRPSANTTDTEANTG